MVVGLFVCMQVRTKFIGIFFFHKISRIKLIFNIVGFADVNLKLIILF